MANIQYTTMPRILFILILSPIFAFSQKIVIQENFEKGLPPSWQVESTHKYKKWKYKQYKNFHYITMSAFSGKNKPVDNIKTALYTPLISKEEKGCKLRFSFADAFSNGNPLELFIVDENNQLIKSIATQHYEHFIDNPSRYDNQFQSTPWIELPVLSKDYKIMFRYNSKGNITTTIQLAEVDVWCQ